MFMIKTVIFALLVSSSTFSFVAKADIDPARVHVVDYRLKTVNGGAAIMYRGNTPVNDAGTALNYTTWYDTLANNTKAQIGVVLDPAEKVYMLDISFENEVLDYQYAAEVAFWNDAANKNKGEFVPWMLLGSMNFPPDFTPAQQQAMASNASLWDTDQLPARVQKIRQMMLAGPPAGYTQLAIYFHCTHGQDRTGEFANAYRMTFHESIEDGGKLAKHRPAQGASPRHGGIHNSAFVNKGAGRADTGSSLALPPPALAGQRLLNVKDDLTTMGKIYSLGCDEGLRCPMYTFTANAGWYCLWSNQFNGTSYNDCATSYSCIPLLFCSATNV